MIICACVTDTLDTGAQVYPYMIICAYDKVVVLGDRFEILAWRKLRCRNNDPLIRECYEAYARSIFKRLNETANVDLTLKARVILALVIPFIQVHPDKDFEEAQILATFNKFESGEKLCFDNFLGGEFNSLCFKLGLAYYASEARNKLFDSLFETATEYE